MPNAAHTGPTFGSIDGSTIDLATATLDKFDGIAVAHVNTAFGFLTLGDGGSLLATSAPPIPVSSSLFVITGDVGGQESLGASIEVNVPAVPELATLTLLGLVLGALGFFNRTRK